MSEELIEYNNMLTLRSQLITVPIEELCILYQDKNVRNNVTALFDKVGKNTGIFDLKKRRIKRTLEKYHKVVNDKE